MTDKQKELRPCPFCGKAFTRPINNMEIYTCNHCIHWSDHIKSPGITGFTLSRAYCWKRIDELESNRVDYLEKFKALKAEGESIIFEYEKKLSQLTQLLGTERDQFGERETELMTKITVAREAFKKIDSQTMPDLSDDLIERSMQLAGLWASLKMIANEALKKIGE